MTQSQIRVLDLSPGWHGSVSFPIPYTGSFDWTCPHGHRTKEAAEKCAKRHLSAVQRQKLEDRRQLRGIAT